MVKSVNANAPDYWQNVRDNASRRRALEIVKARFAKMHVSQIYEQYVEHCLSLVQQTAIKIGFAHNHDLYEQYKRDCAQHFGLPEIVENSPEQICHYSAEAVSEALELLYGEGQTGSNTRYIECEACGEKATQLIWEENEGGSLNGYERTHCEHCGEDKTTCIW